MNQEDLRWRQRLANFARAYSRLADAVQLASERTLSDLETQGLIQAFEFTHELAWKVMKDYFQYQGNTAITGSRDATREAFAAGLLDNGESWMDMIASRNRTSHTYNEDVAKEIADRITGSYAPLFEAFLQKMRAIKRVFDLVKDFGTSQSPKSTRSSTTISAPAALRPQHSATPLLRSVLATHCYRKWLDAALGCSLCFPFGAQAHVG